MGWKILNPNAAQMAMEVLLLQKGEAGTVLYFSENKDRKRIPLTIASADTRDYTVKIIS